jgi:ABC-type lipopolysaccharide export system ATPase subunit
MVGGLIAIVDMTLEVCEGEVLSGPGPELLNNPHVKKAYLGA